MAGNCGEACQPAVANEGDRSVKRSFRKISAAALAGIAFVSGAAAQSSITTSTPNGLVGEYYAHIGPSDLYNSRGARLTEAWQIIRQDRANYHRFGVRDPGDQGDAFFDSADNRDMMESMLRNGFIEPSAARQVVSGGRLIRVRIFEQTVDVEVVR
jgi:hypothetical protein